MPPLPAWTGLHPLIIHFPIGLLFVAPVFVLGALLWRRLGSGWSLAALGLMALGTLSLFLAVATGEAAGQLADRTPQIAAAMERHESMAETARVVFSLLTLAFAALVLVPLVLKRELARKLHWASTALFLAAYAGGLAQLTRTAHEGGRLVHGLGVHSMVASQPGAQANQTPSPQGEGGEPD